MKPECRRAPARATLAIAALATAIVAGGCAHTEHLAVSHRHSPGSEARIVVLPVELPEREDLPPDLGKTLAALYATELLKSYEVLELERFERMLTGRDLTLEAILTDGLDEETVAALGIDGILLSKVYEWDPGKAGFWFLKKKGQIGFQARLVDLNTGGVIWGINRVVETPPAQPLSVGLSLVFADLAEKMPRNLTPF